MNKLFILAAVALVAGVACAQEQTHYDEEMTQFAVFADDDGETAKLSGGKVLFRDFCIQARDDVKTYLKDTANSKASNVFTFIAEIFATTANRVGDESSVAVEQGNQMIREDARAAKAAVGGVASTFMRVASGEFKERIEEIKAELNGENVVGAIKKACNSLSQDLKPKIEEKLTAVKKDLLRSSEAAKFKKVIRETKFANLNCLTVSRVNLISRGCDLMNAILPTLGGFFESKTDADIDDDE